MKASYQRARVFAAVGAVLLPVLSNVPLQVNASGWTVDVTRTLVTVIGLIVALLVSLEGVLHHREQWQNYRTTEQYLRAQRSLFENGVGEYDGLDADAAFKRLVLNVETAIKNENEVTLNVLTRVAAGAEKSSL